MTQTTGVLRAFADRERAARELSQPPAEYPKPNVGTPRNRQVQDVVMCRWLSEWLVKYWGTSGNARYRTSDINTGPVR